MKRWHILLSLLLSGAIFWIIEGMVQHAIFCPHLPATVVLTGAGTKDLFFRGFILGIFLSINLSALLVIKRLSNAENNARRLNRFLRAVRDVGKIVTRETDPHRLITTACKSLTATHGFTTAWIVLFDENGEVCDYAGTIDEENLLKIVRAFLDKTPLPARWNAIRLSMCM